MGRALAAQAVVEALDRRDLDVTDASAVRRALAGADVVVHLAAFTDVNGCERDPARAEAVNVEGTRAVVEAAEDAGAYLIFMSSDYVFDGRAHREYVETDDPTPLNVYGRTKLEAEGLVSSYEGSLIVRTSTVFGDGRNFIRSILTAGRHVGSLKVVVDQISRPTSASQLAQALRHCIELRPRGILHIAGDEEPCSRYELANHVIQAAELDVTLVPVTTRQMEAQMAEHVAPRPLNSVLCLDKAGSLGVPLRGWRDDVAAYVRTVV